MALAKVGRGILAFFVADLLTGICAFALVIEVGFLFYAYQGWAARPGPIQLPWLLEIVFVAGLLPLTIYAVGRTLWSVYGRLFRYFYRAH